MSERLRSLGDVFRKPVRAAGFAAVTSGMLALYEMRELFEPRERRTELLVRWKKRYLELVARIFALDVVVTGDVPRGPEPGRGRLVVSNHRSAIDIAVLWMLFDAQMLSRADIDRWPVIGRGARKLGTIFVDRAQRTSGAAAIRTIRRRLEQGATVCVFPEGTTFAGDDVRPFRPGSFAAARGLDIEIVPVGLAYESGAEFVDETFVAHLGRVAARPRTRIVVAIGQPRRGCVDPAERAREMRDEVQRLVGEARSAFARSE